MQTTSVALWAKRETYAEHVAREYRRCNLVVMGVAHAGLSAPLAAAVMDGRLDLAAWVFACMYATALRLWPRGSGAPTTSTPERERVEGRS